MAFYTFICVNRSINDRKKNLVAYFLSFHKFNLPAQGNKDNDKTIIIHFKYLQIEREEKRERERVCKFCMQSIKQNVIRAFALMPPLTIPYRFFLRLFTLRVCFMSENREPDS